MRPVAYTVHGPAPKLTLVAERFSFPAFLLGSLWLLVQRAWIELALYVVVVVAGFAAGIFLWPGHPVGLLTAVAVHLLTGFEAGEIRRRSLARRDRRAIGVVVGENREDALDRLVLKVRS
ncbi:DUF2628 domain-containing protein [Zavarzinia sp.]|uniref:DUF2628 domain-containing protein n=1 Tax=Zavarzinia sp. TaxID=2027920 RepID=UPI00356B21C9